VEECGCGQKLSKNENKNIRLKDRIHGDIQSIVLPRKHTKLYRNYITTYLDLAMGTAMAMAITAQIRRKRKKHMILFLRAARA